MPIDRREAISLASDLMEKLDEASINTDYATDHALERVCCFDSGWMHLPTTNRYYGKRT
jgi:hypothetical protein